jgi:hypothetical protein
MIQSEIKLKEYNKFLLYILTITFLFCTTSLLAKEQNYCAYNTNAESILNNYDVNSYFDLSYEDKVTFDDEIKTLPADIIIVDTSSINQSNANIAYSGISEIFKNLEMGERLILYKLGSDGQPISLFNKCYPGCPKQGWASSFFGSECLKGKAKKDKMAFKGQFTSHVKNLLKEGVKNTSNTNNLISKISFLSEDLSNFSSEDKICIFSSLIENSEYGDFNSKDESVFNKAFVTAILKNQIPKGYKENITFYGVNPSQEVRNFWRDIFSLSKSNPQILSSICTQ